MTPARISVIIGAMILGCLLAAQAEGAKGKLTPEDYVLQQVAAGQWADLKERFGEKEENRRLSARFLEDLLTGTYKVHRKGVMIKNAIITEALDLELANIPHSVDLADCRFKEMVVFQDAVFEKHFNISGSHFEKAADFHRIKVKINLFCRSAAFQGPVDFGSADIKGQFSAKGAQFQGQGGVNKANFNGLKVGHSARFDNGTFKGPVDFVSADIGGQFNADGAHFEGQGKENKATFSGLKVGQEAFFDNAAFKGPVAFVGADIKGQFNAKGARFESTEHPADFSALKVGKIVFLDNATFKGPVDFVSADIGGEFSADGAQFLNKTQAAKFEGMRVGQGAFFRDVTCRSEVNLTYGTFLDLYFQGAGGEKQEEAGGQTKLNLKGTQIHRELLVENLELKSLEASHLRVKGPATFQYLGLKESADFQNAALETLKFKQVTWPVEQAKRKLDGLTYSSLFVDQPDNFPGLLGLVERSAFNPQNYRQLEAFLEKSGQPDWADEVFIRGKRRELWQKSWWNPATWFTFVFWDLLAGYGRKPLLSFGLGLLIVLVGAVYLFNPQYLKIEVLNTWKLNYDVKMSAPLKSLSFFKDINNITNLGKLVLLRLILSFEQFIPAINLGLIENWQAQDLSFGKWSYFQFQKISGWILVPIGLAAIYSQFK